jgi:tRNA-splicing endonuclease subunit Sen2
MPNRGRRRGKDVTSLPAGAKVLTGKSRSAIKNATYDCPLPINLDTTPTKQLDDGPKDLLQVLLKPIVRYFGAVHDPSASQELRPDVVRARYDPLTKTFSIEIPSGDLKHPSLLSASASVRLLWECGFFGKGNLSRSEPTWATRSLQARAIQKQRQYGQKIFTPEELTSLRRRERRAAKIERARLAVRAGQQLPDGILALGGELTAEDELAIAQQVQLEIHTQHEQGQVQEESLYGKHIPGLMYLKPKAEEMHSTVGKVPLAGDDEAAITENLDQEEDDYGDFEDLESLQLNNEEVFFLSAVLGVLEVVDNNDEILSMDEVFSLILRSSHDKGSASRTGFGVLPHVAPDHPFLVQYVAYHYFRSQGWVVRTGTKFCVDWLLYKRGPAFSHAEFAVIVLPAYEDEHDEEQSEWLSETRSRARDWVWFSSTNRVNTQVLKVSVTPLGSFIAG